MKTAHPELPHIQAHLRVRPTADGGRTGAIFPGYRAGWWLPQPDGRHTDADGAVYPLAADEIAPGMAGAVRIYPLLPVIWRDLGPGAEIEMREGPRVVGVATVVESLSAADPAPDRRSEETLVRSDRPTPLLGGRDCPDTRRVLP